MRTGFDMSDKLDAAFSLIRQANFSTVTDAKKAAFVLARMSGMDSQTTTRLLHSTHEFYEKEINKTHTGE